MDMNGPVGRTPLDDANGLVGRPLDRVDGRLKVTGGARYAFETRETARPAYGFLVEAGVPRGRIRAIDAAAARAAPGVLLVMTHETAPPQGAGATSAPQLAGPEVTHRGQPVALVVARTFEEARAASRLVTIAYEAEPPRADLRADLGRAVEPKAQNAPADTRVGDVAAAYAAAPVQLDVTYTTPVQTHAMMEPHATLASWEGERVTLFTSNQMLARGRAILAETLGVPPENVRLVSRFVGGGFGAKLAVQADAVLAALAARALGRPVKVALTRQQVFHVTTHRTATVQRLRLGAERDGRLVALGHESWSHNNPGKPFFESSAQATRAAYATPNLETRHRLVALDLPEAAAMRAPGEAVGLLALECAMDELAERLGLDPIELRVRNEPAVDPTLKVPFSTRQLVPCLREGARLFGWERRDPRPGRVRDGRWLVGLGVAAAIRNNPLQPSKARVRLGPEGNATVRMDMTDIGTGSYTIFAQVAGDLLGLPMERVRVELGDTAFPASSGSGGSFGASSAGSGVYDACMKLRAALLARAGMDPDGATFAGGRVRSGARDESLAALAGPEGMEADGEIRPGSTSRDFSQKSYGAQFAEVGVEVDTGEVRLRRMLGVFTGGRILNPKTARSQAIGGMIFGIGAALMEEVVVDDRLGLFVNHDLAEYHVPVHADVPRIEAVFLPEVDDKANPLKSKGLGELGICGAGAALANAVYNASGVRVRDYPLTLDKVLSGLS